MIDTISKKRKMNKMVYIDSDLIERFSSENFSELVNRLLRKHSEELDFKNMSDEDADKLLKILDIRIEADNKIKEIEKEAQNGISE